MATRDTSGSVGIAAYLVQKELPLCNITAYPELFTSIVCIYSDIMISEVSPVVLMYNSVLVEGISVQTLAGNRNCQICCVKISADSVLFIS
jgi:hypothetical protein